MEEFPERSTEEIADDLNDVPEKPARSLLQLMTFDITDDERTPTEVVRHYRHEIAQVMANTALNAATGIGRRAAEIVYGAQTASDKIKEIRYNKRND